MKPADAELIDVLPEPVARFVREQPDDDLSGLTVVERRRYSLALADLNHVRYGRAAVDVASVRDVTIAGVRCRLYTPDDWRGALHLHLHGGGFWAGTIDELVTDAACRRRARDGGVAVLAIEYRLAPEHPFPAGLHDAFAVASASIGSDDVGLGHDPDNVSVGGVSAGGNLAAAVCVMPESPAPRLRGLLLEVPALDLSPEGLLVVPGSTETAEYEALAVAYLGRTAASDPLASPVRADDLSSFPPTHIRVSQHDVLRGSAETFARRLEHAGVPVTSETTEGALHGVLSLDRVWEPARRWQDEAGRILRTWHHPEQSS
ncbi:alpha/beta hydrolase [Agromyces laixinhei]|uniref:alpha/beta hydrolase n=1 Tax=Agromyces laixinhei TaxID=2585717 RepID=UPI0012EDEC70|nr:alpha/beta hydrolase [Agromyces laixinhei]